MLPPQCPRFSGSLVFQQDNQSKRLNSRSIAINLLSWLLEQQNSRIHWPIHSKSNAKFCIPVSQFHSFWTHWTCKIDGKNTHRQQPPQNTSGDDYGSVRRPFARVFSLIGLVNPIVFSMMKFPVQHATLYQKYKKFWTSSKITFPNPLPTDILVHPAFKSFKRSVSPGLK